jgi:signal transduction histidine kinase
VTWEDGTALTRAQVQRRLLFAAFWLTLAAALGLAARELWTGSPALPALSGALAAALALGVGRRFPGLLRAVGFVHFVALVALVTWAAWDLGGAVGSALSLALLPGLLGVLSLGPVLGWSITCAMLVAMGGLFVIAPATSLEDRQRFSDEVMVVVFSAALAHTLDRGLRAYERALSSGHAALLKLEESRKQFALVIYQKLEPTVAELSRLLAGDARGENGPAITARYEELVLALRAAKGLAQTDSIETELSGDPDQAIRTRTMRLWLRLAIVLELGFIVRNVAWGTAYLPAFFTILACVTFDLWLGSSAAKGRLELTALAIGLAATAPMPFFVHDHGAVPTAPPLVVTPLIILFTSLLSQGAATWFVMALNAAMLVWVSIGRTLSLLEARLLGDLVLTYLVLALILWGVFSLRRGYVDTLLRQRADLLRALRTRRRLAGTLFHDVGNRAQGLALAAACWGPTLPAQDREFALKTVGKLADLVRSSKRLNVAGDDGPLELAALPAHEAFEATVEIFQARLEEKQIQIVQRGDVDAHLCAHFETLVESVLGNLLSNAIKFTPKGGRIVLEAHAQEDAVELTIVDEGAGIPAEIVAQIADDSEIRSRPGTEAEPGHGFGLRLAAEHLGRMGGRLRIEPAPSGTKVSIWLPLDREPAA